MKKKRELYNLLSVIFLIFFYPLGIPFMWVTKSFSKKARRIITAYFIITIIVGLAALIFWTSSHGYTQ